MNFKRVFAILVTLLLTLGIFSLAIPTLSNSYAHLNAGELSTALHGLVAMVLLFDLYTIFQQVQIYRIRRRLMEHEELFRLPEDAQERHNLADDPVQKPVLERLRATLGKLTAGPLTPQRFNP